MKGEYVEQQQQQEQQEEDEILHHGNSATNSANSTLEIANSTPNSPKFQTYPSLLSPPPHLLQVHQHPPSKKPKITPTTTNIDSSTVSTPGSGRRGRPRGSKNKATPPVIITREPEPAMSPYILELSPGADIVGSLTRFTRRRGVSICVLTATGTVEDVTLKQPPNGTVSFHGMFDILSLSACLMSAEATPFGGFTVTMAGPQGMVVGGKVVGRLVCAGVVYVVATSFNNPSFTRLPLEGEGGRVAGGDGGQSRSHVSEGGGGGDGDGDGDGDGGDDNGETDVHMGSVSCSQGLWAPTPLAARPPQPPY